MRYDYFILVHSHQCFGCTVAVGIKYYLKCCPTIFVSVLNAQGL